MDFRFGSKYGSDMLENIKDEKLVKKIKEEQLIRKMKDEINSSKETNKFNAGEINSLENVCENSLHEEGKHFASKLF